MTAEVWSDAVKLVSTGTSGARFDGPVTIAILCRFVGTSAKEIGLYPSVLEQPPLQNRHRLAHLRVLHPDLVTLLAFHRRIDSQVKTDTIRGKWGRPFKRRQ